MALRRSERHHPRWWEDGMILDELGYRNERTWCDSGPLVDGPLSRLSPSVGRLSLAGGPGDRGVSISDRPLFWGFRKRPKHQIVSSAAAIETLS
jgi:hypothetical protein